MTFSSILHFIRNIIHRVTSSQGVRAFIIVFFFFTAPVICFALFLLAVGYGDSTFLYCSIIAYVALFEISRRAVRGRLTAMENLRNSLIGKKSD